MTRISMVGNDLKLDDGVGTCGKEGQDVPGRRRSADAAHRRTHGGRHGLSDAPRCGFRAPSTKPCRTVTRWSASRCSPWRSSVDRGPRGLLLALGALGLIGGLVLWMRRRDYRANHAEYDQRSIDD